MLELNYRVDGEINSMIAFRDGKVCALTFRHSLRDLLYQDSYVTTLLTEVLQTDTESPGNLHWHGIPNILRLYPDELKMEETIR